MLDLAGGQKNLLHMEVTVFSIVIGSHGIVPLKPEMQTKGIKNQRKNQDYLDHRIIKIGLNIEKSPGNWMRLAISQTPGKIRQK